MIRSTCPEDVPTIRSIVDVAYSPYVTGIGRPPGPMGDDYAARPEFIATAVRD